MNMNFWNNILKKMANKSNNAGFSINNPTSFRNEVNMSPEEWNRTQIPGGKDYNPKDYSIADSTEAVPVRSTAIASAEYNPKDDSLNISYTSNPSKSYKFKANGEKGLKQWIEASSKGRITQKWRETHRYPGY